MAGTMLGMRFGLVEAVTLREPPLRKAWRTLSTDLLVIGRYELGFELELLFGRSYARWCVARMAVDAARHFALLDSAHEKHAGAGIDPQQDAHRR